MCDLKAKKPIRADLGHQKWSVFVQVQPKQKAVSEQRQGLKNVVYVNCIEPSILQAWFYM